MTNSSRALATWSLALAAPLVASLVVYAAADPFCVLHRRLYDRNHPVAINRDYASTELYLRQQPTHDYDSFVLGNSRSLAFQCADWLAAMQRPGQRCFHFDSWKESLFGVEAKVRLIDQVGQTLKDVLIVLDSSLLAEVVPSKEPAFRSHPRLIGQSWLAFQADYLTDFFSNHFLIKYADFAAFGKVRRYMGPAFNARNFTHLLDTNDELFTALDQLIAREGNNYWRRRPDIFTVPPGGTSSPWIGDAQRRLLTSMASVFAKRGARVRLVVSPLYDQIQMAPADVRVLREIFGASGVIDASGRNELTADQHNFYEGSHYRPVVARRILGTLYEKP